MAVSRMCSKNMQYNPYLWWNHLNSHILQEIRVEGHDGDIRFETGSGNIAISHLRSKKYAI